MNPKTGQWESAKDTPLPTASGQRQPEGRSPFPSAHPASAPPQPRSPFPGAVPPGSPSQQKPSSSQGSSTPGWEINKESGKWEEKKDQEFDWRSKAAKLKKVAAAFVGVLRIVGGFISKLIREFISPDSRDMVFAVIKAALIVLDASSYVLAIYWVIGSVLSLLLPGFLSGLFLWAIAPLSALVGLAIWQAIQDIEMGIREHDRSTLEHSYKSAVDADGRVRDLKPPSNPSKTTKTLFNKLQNHFDDLRSSIEGDRRKVYMINVLVSGAGLWFALSPLGLSGMPRLALWGVLTVATVFGFEWITKLEDRLEQRDTLLQKGGNTPLNRKRKD